MKEGATSQGTRRPPEAGKGKGVGSPLEPPEGHSPADTDVSTVRPEWTSDLRSCKSVLL